MTAVRRLKSMNADIAVTIGSSAGDDFNVGSGKLLVEGDTTDIPSQEI